MAAAEEVIKFPKLVELDAAANNVTPGLFEMSCGAAHLEVIDIGDHEHAELLFGNSSWAIQVGEDPNLPCGLVRRNVSPSVCQRPGGRRAPR